MKIPTTPPNIEHFIQQTDTNKLRQILNGHFAPTDAKNRYLHWDKLQHLTPPKGFTSKDYWVGTKLARQALYKDLPLFDKYQKPFRLALPDCVLKKLYWIDKNINGNWRDNILVHPQTRKSHLINALIEEATSSSQLEGASTTRRFAKEMLRQGRKPKDRSEQMIFNNYHAMQFIQDYKNERLTPAIIFELHRILTEGTLNAAGQFRTPSDDIHVVNVQLSQALHTPPNAEELPERLQHFCQFANDEHLSIFIPPIIKAIVLHFMLAYDHPFVDGNGRTARAIFYWSTINQDYWLMEFISISRIIKQAIVQYGRAFLYTETDDNDLTYFIIHQLEVIEKAIEQFHHYLEQKCANIEEVEQLLDNTKIAGKLNHRQLALLEHALKNPYATYTIQAHQKTYGISHQTARQDLLKMADNMQLLRQRKVGKSVIFVSPSDLKERLKRQD
ncbi:MAG: Fic family protein [Pseudomonadota bacterium]